MMLLLALLFQLVLGDLAPLLQHEPTVDNGALRSYVIVFNDEAPTLNKVAVQKWIQSDLASVDPEQIGEVWNIYDLFRGFAIWLKPEGVTEMRGHKYVKYVEEDSVVSIGAFTDRQDYGQIRINQGNRNLTTNNANYTYASAYPNQNLDTTVWNFVSGIQATYTNDGSRAAVCVIDTGVRGSHQEFNGRLFANISYVAGQTADGNGHGTHCAGSCCGRYRGTARNTRILSAKVLSDTGSGTNANVISGINWCANQQESSRTYILSMSLGGGQNTAINDAINSAATKTIPVVAAGNDNGDSCTKSPASAARAITVGASDKDDNKASFSNYGRCLDIWAPGVSIHSSWYTSDTAYNTISGTSMATPLVAGLVATYAPQSGTITRDQALSQLQTLSAATVRNVPAGTPTQLASTGRKP